MGNNCCPEKKIAGAKQFTLDESIESSRRTVKRAPTNLGCLSTELSPTISEVLNEIPQKKSLKMVPFQDQSFDLENSFSLLNLQNYERFSIDNADCSSPEKDFIQIQEDNLENINISSVLYGYPKEHFFNYKGEEKLNYSEDNQNQDNSRTSMNLLFKILDKN
jgi:hypothetical protein